MTLLPEDIDEHERAEAIQYLRLFADNIKRQVYLIAQSMTNEDYTAPEPLTHRLPDEGNATAASEEVNPEERSVG